MGSVLVAMSGGVDSSVAAALLRDEGHAVVGVTMKLWGGESDSGCCSVADVDDARRVAHQLGIDHLVFNFTDDFEDRVVSPYVAAHRDGRTPNPCIECNRHLKFDRLVRRARHLGFDAVATGHHCRIVSAGGQLHVARGADRAKDQSYVVHMLRSTQLEQIRFPVGSFTKADVRTLAAGLRLRTAAKPDSQDVCFITATGGRDSFLRERIDLHAAPVVDSAGQPVGRVDAVELITIGQRRGLGGSGGGPRRFVTAVDTTVPSVTVGTGEELLTGHTQIDAIAWADRPVEGRILVQVSAHGAPRPAIVRGSTVLWERPQRRVAPGQAIVFYEQSDTVVIGAATATA